MQNLPARRPIVWVVKEQVLRGPTGPVPMDYTSAYRYGDVEFVTRSDLPLTRGESSLKDQWTASVRDFLRRYDAECDFIVLTGSPLAIFLLGVVIGSVGPTARPKVLVWRRETDQYVPFDSLEIFKPETIPNSRN